MKPDSSSDELEGPAAFGNLSMRAVLDTLIDPHVMLRAVRDEAGEIVDFEYVEANEAACEYNGLTHDELVGKRLLELLPGQAGGILDAYRMVIDTGEPLILDDYSLVQDLPAMRGEVRQYDIRVSRSGDALSYTWRDVTDRYRARQALASSEERFRLAMAIVPVGIGVVDLAWGFTEANPTLCQMLGRDRQWLLSHRMEQVLVPGEMTRLSRAASDLLSGTAAAVSLEQRFLTGTGDTVPLTHRVALARDADGNPNSFVSQVVDGARWTSGDESVGNVPVGAPALVTCRPEDQLLGNAVAALLDREKTVRPLDVVPIHQLAPRVASDTPELVVAYLPEGVVATEVLRAVEDQLESHPDMGLVILSVDPQPGVRDMALRMSRPTAVLNMRAHTDLEVVDQALSAVVQGLTAVNQAENGWSLAQAVGTEDPLATLTDRERDVLARLARGLDNNAIAEELVITTKAVENYVGTIFRKLHLTEEEGTNHRLRAALIYLGAG